MAGVVYLTLYILTSLTFVEVISSEASARRDGLGVTAVAPSCVPGDVFQGPGCGKCFCNAERKPICSPRDSCKLSDKVLKMQELISTANRVQLSSLSDLPDRAGACIPGKTYRVDCNRCICLKMKSLVCEELSCPNYDDVNKQTAVEMSGKSCATGDVKNQNCVKCTCDGGSYTCKSVNGCIPSAALSWIPADNKSCVPGKSVDNPNGGPDKCTCTLTGQISCPGQGDTKRSNNLKSESKLKPECFPGEMFDNPTGGPKCWCTIFAQIFCPPKSGSGSIPSKLDGKIQSRKPECFPGERFDNPNGGLKCWCTILAQMYCPPKDGDKTLANSLKKKTLGKGSKMKSRRRTTLGWGDYGLKYPGGMAGCTPGMRYRRACNICFCSQSRTLKCTSQVCLKHTLPPSGFNKPKEQPFDKALLTNKKCKPGVQYRRACNVCICSQRRTLKCTSKACLKHALPPSGFNKPKEQPFDMALLTNKKCKPGVNYRHACNVCICGKNRRLKCTSKVCLKHALPPSGFIKPKEQPFDQVLVTNKKCTPGVMYRQNCNTCTCTDGHVLKCTSKQCLNEEDGRSLFHPRTTPTARLTREPVVEPFDQSFLDHTKKCTPGVIYRKECNKCTCTKEGDLQCTTMACPDAKQVAILNRMRLRLQKDYQDN